MHRKSFSRLSLWLIGCLFVLAACEPQRQLSEQRILQFGTIIDISIIHSDADGVERAFVEIEKQLQDYRLQWHAWEDSDLYRFNQSLKQAGEITVPESLGELISLSQYYYEASQQLFNPALGRLISAYGFHGNEIPDQALIEEIQKNLPRMPDLLVNADKARSTNPHLLLDFGGIAKGYAMEKIAQDLKTRGFEDFLINAGGDVLVSGQRFDKPWTIAVQNPFAPGAIASIKLSGNQQLFTSGNYQRYYQKPGGIVHHIVDPRTGKPSDNISSATVLTTDAVLADVAATTLMIDGWKNHESLADSLGIKNYLIVSDDKEIIVSESLFSKIEVLADEFDVRVY